MNALWCPPALLDPGTLAQFVAHVRSCHGKALEGQHALSRAERSAAHEWLMSYLHALDGLMVEIGDQGDGCSGGFGSVDLLGAWCGVLDVLEDVGRGEGEDRFHDVGRRLGLVLERLEGHECGPDESSPAPADPREGMGEALYEAFASHGPDSAKTLEAKIQAIGKQHPEWGVPLVKRCREIAEQYRAAQAAQGNKLPPVPKREYAKRKPRLES